jgi:glutathione S-transferase
MRDGPKWRGSCPNQPVPATLFARISQKGEVTVTDELVFYTNPMSRGRIVRWMLEEVGAPYRTEVLNYANSMKAPDYLAVNPMGKVPAITHRGQAVTECAAICAYLADAFPPAGLAPPPTDRAAYYRWMFYAAGPIEAAVTNKSLGFVVPEGRGVMAGYGSFEAVMDTLDKALAGRRYIAGDAFTAADVYFGSQIGWGLQFGSIEKRPSFEAYWAGLVDRPAAVRAREIDDALIAGK